MHGSFYETVLVRNLSETGALIEGLHGMDKGELCILDFGDGQLAFARVSRAAGRNQGVAFEHRLVSDGDGGLCTPHRVSPYMLATMGVPGVGASDQPIEVASELLPLEALGKQLGLALSGQEGDAKPAFPAPAKQSGPGRRHDRDGHLTHEESRRLIDAALASPNRQLKYIVSLLMVTGARPGELLRARWSQIDVDNAVWHIPISGGGKARRLELGQAALDLFGALPRWDDCPHVIANPITRKPYRTLDRSWEAVRVKAGLPFTELDDLRYCQVDIILSSPELLEVMRGPLPKAEEPEWVDILTPPPGPEEDEPELPEWVDILHPPLALDEQEPEPEEAELEPEVGVLLPLPSAAEEVEPELEPEPEPEPPPGPDDWLLGANQP